MSIKKRKFKINTNGKSYCLHDSPLYKLKSKKKLEGILFSDSEALKTLSKDENNYNVFNDAGRLIQAPKESLDRVHSRIASLICRVKQPDYVHSGQKSRSHVSNAEAHIEPNKALTTDIKGFFQSTPRSQVFKFFYYKLQCSPDVANLLADICTYNGHIPTGSRISMPLAYWANSDMFNELSNLAKKHNITMSLYVDDLTFSGGEVNRLFKSLAKRIITRHGHLMHPKKTKLFKKDDTKVITGVVIRNGEKYIKNAQHLAIYQDIEGWKAIRDLDSWPFANKGRLLGRLNSLSVIDPKLRDKARSIISYKKPERA